MMEEPEAQRFLEEVQMLPLMEKAQTFEAEQMFKEKPDPWVAQMFPEESEEFINSLTRKIAGCSISVLKGAYTSQAVETYGLSPKEVQKLESKGVIVNDPPPKAFPDLKEVAEHYGIPYYVAKNRAVLVPNAEGTFHLKDPYLLDRLARVWVQ